MLAANNGLPVGGPRVVVLLPPAFLGAVATVFRPDRRPRYGVLVVAIAIRLELASGSGIPPREGQMKPGDPQWNLRLSSS